MFTDTLNNSACFDAIAALSGFVLLNIIIGQVVHFAALTAVHDLKDTTKAIV